MLCFVATIFTRIWPDSFGQLKTETTRFRATPSISPWIHPGAHISAVASRDGLPEIAKLASTLEHSASVEKDLEGVLKLTNDLLALCRSPQKVGVALTDGKRDVLLASKNGKSIRFKEEDARPMGRVSRGVRGMTLEGDDLVIGMEIINPNATGSTIFTVTENGFGKRTELDEYPVQGRGGKGVITIKTTERNGCVVDIMQVVEENDLMVITDQGKILRIPVAGFSVIGRNTQGVRVMVTEPEERIVAVAKLAEKEESDELADGDEETVEPEVTEE